MHKIQLYKACEGVSLKSIYTKVLWCMHTYISHLLYSRKLAGNILAGAPTFVLGELYINLVGCPETMMLSLATLLKMNDGTVTFEMANCICGYPVYLDLDVH